MKVGKGREREERERKREKRERDSERREHITVTSSWLTLCVW